MFTPDELELLSDILREASRCANDKEDGLHYAWSNGYDSKERWQKAKNYADAVDALLIKINNL